MNDQLKEVLSLALKWQPVGSRVTCNPAPENTDQDYLVLVGDDAGDFIDQMNSYGFDVELGEGYAEDALNSGEDNRFQSYRMDDVILIATVDPYFYDRFVAATSVAKLFNLLDKSHRIALFQAVLYGNRCDADIGHAHYTPERVLALPAPTPPPPWAAKTSDDADELIDSLN